MTDSEIDAIATGILLRANDEKWYEQKERIAFALRSAYRRGYNDRDPSPSGVYSLPPRDFIPGHRQVNEEG